MKMFRSKHRRFATNIQKTKGEKLDSTFNDKDVFWFWFKVFSVPPAQVGQGGRVETSPQQVLDVFCRYKWGQFS